jgi:hypothetical protein
MGRELNLGGEESVPGFQLHALKNHSNQQNNYWSSDAYMKAIAISIFMKTRNY